MNRRCDERGVVAIFTTKARWSTGGTPVVWFQHDSYTRDAIGRVTRIDDNGLEAVAAPSNVDECFLYDQWNRLIRAHSVVADGTCAANTTAATLSANSLHAYDMVWTFDDINRMRTNRISRGPSTSRCATGFDPNLPD